MNRPGAFVDLRLNRRDWELNEGFWPSFTDIMTVVVMVFLLALVSILIRNNQLVAELRATMAAERAASALAQASSEEKTRLAARVDALEEELARLRLRLVRVEEERAREQAARARAEQDVAQLKAQSREQAARLAEAEAGRAALTRQLAARTRERDRARAEVAQLQDRLAAGRAALAQAREEYGELKRRYDKLVKPARTSAGKLVIEVRYYKEAGRPVIELKLPGAKAYRRVDRATLTARLDALKRRHPDRLYVKIVIPEDSGLSYNEAWRFTTDLLRRYDYYYQ